MKKDAILRAQVEEDLLGAQARELSGAITTLAEVIVCEGLLDSELDTTLHEARALDLLGRKQLWSMSEFARELSITLSTASHTVDKLVQKGAVKRGRSEHDRRLVLVSLSGKGLKRHYAIFQNRIRVCIGILDQLSPAEREISLSTVRRLAALAASTPTAQRIG